MNVFQRILFSVLDALHNFRVKHTPLNIANLQTPPQPKPAKPVLFLNNTKTTYDELVFYTHEGSDHLTYTRGREECLVALNRQPSISVNKDGLVVFYADGTVTSKEFVGAVTSTDNQKQVLTSRV